MRGNNKKKYLYKKGTTLLEFVIYLSITFVILIFVVNILVLSSQTFRGASASKEIKSSANVFLTRIISETRDAYFVDTEESIFNESPGRLVLDNSSGRIQVFLDSGIIYIYKDGINLGNLTTEDVFVESLLFKHIQNGNSQSIKIEVNIKDDENEYLKSENFYTTIILRGSYAK